jgi:hypothetical protein
MVGTTGVIVVAAIAALLARVAQQRASPTPMSSLDQTLEVKLLYSTVLKAPSARAQYHDGSVRRPCPPTVDSRRPPRRLDAGATVEANSWRA